MDYPQNEIDSEISESWFVFIICLRMSEGSMNFFGKKYITARQAAFKSGYSQDYIGQLCRSGKIDARRVGRAWYVLESGLVAYEQETRSALSSQAQAAILTSRKTKTNKPSASSSYGIQTVKVFAAGIALLLFLSILFTSIPTIMEKTASGNQNVNRADVGGVTTGTIQAVVQDLTTDDVKVWSDENGRTGVIRSEKKEVTPR